MISKTIGYNGVHYFQTHPHGRDPTSVQPESGKSHSAICRNFLPVEARLTRLCIYSLKMIGKMRFPLQKTLLRVPPLLYRVSSTCHPGLAGQNGKTSIRSPRLARGSTNPPKKQRNMRYTLKNDLFGRDN